MPGVTLSSADAILKDLMVGPIIETVNNKTYMLDQVERDSDHLDHTGRRAILPIHIGRNRGRGSRGDRGILPKAGRQVEVDAIVDVTAHYYAIEVSDRTIEATKSNEGAFVRKLEDESKRVAQDMRKDMQRQIFGTGDGVLCTVAGAEGIGQTVISVDNAQYCEVGDPIAILKKSDGTVGVAETEIDAVDLTPGANTITIADALTGAADGTYGVYIFRSRNEETDGLRNIVAESRTLHGLDSTQPHLKRAWNSKVEDLNGAKAGESIFTKVDNRVGATGQGEVDVWITTRGIQTRLAETYQSQKRLNDAKAMEIHGGYSGIMVNGKPVLADDDCPVGEAFAIDKDGFRWVEQTTPGWLQSKDGQVFHLVREAGEAVASWEAWFRWYAGLACVAPGKQGRLTECEDELIA